ncbi:MAG: globin domain-containing protein [Phycisphaerales bacterium]|nr:globin domain-containing protein [Phycisphaerales bacterium]
MDQALIERLENSFNLLAPRGPELVDRFYAHLFSKNPGVRPMFPEEMSGQKKKLLASLVLVMQNIRKPEKLQQPLIEMGRRHVGYGTKPEHYPIVRDTLVQVMSEMAGDQWADQLTEDWNAALNVVAGIMIEGHKLEEKQSQTQTAS